MKPQASIDRWLARWGWKALLILMAVAAVIRAWMMWQQLPGASP